MVINIHICFTQSIFINCRKIIAINVAARLHCANLNQLSANTAQFHTFPGD